jgi:hypothetical protein
MEQSGNTPPASTSRGQPIGGWLILPALGTALGPFATIYYFLEDLRTLSANNPELIGSVWFFTVHGIEAMVFAYNIGVAVLFIKRKRSLPAFFIGLLAFRVVSVISIQVLTHLFLDSDFTSKPISRVAIYAAIWMPYFALSKRVHATFVN